MNILVTGIVGFIGFSFAQKLAKKYPKNKIIGLDNFDDYYSVRLKKDRSNYLKKNKNIKIIKADITNKNNLKKIFKKYKPKIIFNFAAQAGVRYSLKNPRKYLDTNINGFFNLCECAKNYNTQKMFYASSSSVYGDTKKFPLKENDKLNPKNIYGLSKKFNEELAEVYSFNSKVKFIGLRFFTVYGQWGRPDMMMIKYINCSLKNKNFELYNYGNHVRDFTYIDNVIQANMLSLIVTDKKALNTVYNVAYGERNTLNDLVGYLKDYLSRVDSSIKDIPILHGPNREGDIPHSLASIDKAKELLNYNPQYSLERGLQEAVKWYWENL